MVVHKRRRKYYPKRISEDDVEEYLIKKVQEMGGDCIKGNPHNQRGMPDRICILPNGLLVFVELKRPGKKPRPNQRLMINRFRLLGHHAVWANSFGMVDKLIEWCRVQVATTKVVGADYICNRPECKRRVKKSWVNHLQCRQNTNS